MNGELLELRDALSALRARWWLPIVGLLLAGGIAFGITSLQTPLYRTSTQLFVTSTQATATSDPALGSQLAQDRASSYAQLVTGQDLARRIVLVLGLPMTPEEFAKEITATAVPGTVLIDVTVTDPSPERAFTIARTIGLEFPSVAQGLETAGGGPAPVRVTVAEQPQQPTKPASPETVLDVAIAAGFGLLVGAVVALMVPLLDRSVRHAEQAAELTGAPVVGVVPKRRGRSRGKATGRGAAVETNAYRRIRVNLQLLDAAGLPARLLMVSSALPGDGRTTLTLGLGRILASAGQTVTIVEAWPQARGVAYRLGLVADRGLTHVLSGAADVDDVILSHAETGLSVIPAGPVAGDPAKELSPDLLLPVLEKLRGRSDFVLLLGPPLLPVPEAAELARHTDGVLLAVRCRRTKVDQLEQAAAILGFAHARTVGVVLTRARMTRDGLRPRHRA
jgi:capsular polysaccharide biosynthesis protein